MTGPSPHSVILCCRESGRPHDEQTDLSVRLIAANLSLVGMRSCSVLYHVDFISLETGLTCRFFPHLVPGSTGKFPDNPHFGWWACLHCEYLQGIIHPPLEIFTCSVGCKWGHISHVDDKVAKVYKLGCDAGSIGGLVRASWTCQ